MSPYYVTCGEPRKTFMLSRLSEALHFALRRELHGDGPVRVLEELDWQGCLTPAERVKLREAA